MKTLRPATLLAMTLLLLATSAAAVEQEGGIRFLFGSPADAFGDIVDDEGYGLELTYGLRAHPMWTLGLGANVMIYGSESTDYELPLVDDFEVETDNSMAGGFLFAQFRPLQGAVQPYAEGRIGLSYLWTESSLDDDDWFDDEIAHQTNYDDTTTFWGVGGGLLFRLSEGNEDEGKPGVLLDVKVHHQQGGKAKYLKEGDIAIVDERPVFTPNESETDLTLYQVGVTLTF